MGRDEFNEEYAVVFRENVNELGATATGTGYCGRGRLVDWSVYLDTTKL
jgi:hypothetical protein